MGQYYRWVNPFPTLLSFKDSRICATLATAPRPAADRPRGTVARVWTGTKYPRPGMVTARRSTRLLRSGLAPKDTAEWHPHGGMVMAT